MFRTVDVNVHKHNTVLEAETLFHFLVQLIEPGNLDTHVAIGLSQLDKIRQ